MNKAVKKKLVSLAFLTAIVIFLGVYVAQIEYTQLPELSLDWPFLLLAIIVALTFRYFGVYVWQAILQELGAAPLPGFSVLVGIHAKAWMGRYIPGKVAWIAGKVLLASNLGLSKSRLMVSAVLEGGMQVLALLFVSLLLIGLDPRLDAVAGAPKVVLIGVAGIFLLLLTPRIFNAVVARIYLTVRKTAPGQQLKINGRAALRSFFLYSFGAILSGTSFFLLAKAVYPDVPWSLYIYFVGIYNLAGALGMATPILPGGIGVRDGVILLLLGTVLPPEMAIALTVLSRAWSVGADVLFYLLASLTPQKGAVQPS